MRFSPKRGRLPIVLALAGAAIGATTPAHADAASTCSYNPSTKTVIIDDHSGGASLRIARTVQGQIRIADGLTSPVTTCPNSVTKAPATVFNTDKIAVFATPADAVVGFGSQDFYWLDQSGGPLGPGATPEADGFSEIEVSVSVSGATQSPPVRIDGTSGDDAIRVGSGGTVNLGTFSSFEEDVDVTFTAPPILFNLQGRGGSDFLTGGGNEISRDPGPAEMPINAFGGPGNDQLNGGAAAEDALVGGLNDDRYFTVDAASDSIHELFDEGKDFANVDFRDRVSPSVEDTLRQFAVGRWSLTPGEVGARAGEATRVSIGWRHPQAWNQLRSLELRARGADGKALATVAIDPAHDRFRADGALTSLRDTAIRHHGRRVSADLALRPAKALAGKALLLELQATDSHGRSQLVPVAGHLTVAR